MLSPKAISRFNKSYQISATTATTTVHRIFWLAVSFSSVLRSAALSCAVAWGAEFSFMQIILPMQSRQSIEPRQQQQLALTPQLQQAIRLLQYSAHDLEQEVAQALLDNP